ncbi:MAG: hypothetical protein J6N76_06880, partial [Lachnospiraceae bacterium]|nr:hypothetical protein [Lachnospiraceae bacterium]
AAYPVDESGNVLPFDSYSHHTGRASEGYTSYSDTIIHIGEHNSAADVTADGTRRHDLIRGLWGALFGVTESVDSGSNGFCAPSMDASGIESASYSTGGGFENPNPDSSEDLWAVFYGTTFNNVYIEAHFPVYFKDCTFNHCTVDSRSSNDLVFSGCSFYGGMRGTTYESETGSGFKGVIYSSGGKNIVLAGCLISGGAIDDGLDSFIYSSSANVYMYNTTVDMSFDRDIITILSDRGHEATARINGGSYRGCGTNSLIHNIGAAVADIKGGDISGFDKALFIESGGAATIEVDPGSHPEDRIHDNNYGGYIVGGSRLNYIAGSIANSGADGVYLTGNSVLDMTGGSISHSKGSGIKAEGGSLAELSENAVSANNAEYGVMALGSDVKSSGTIRENGIDGIRCEQGTVEMTRGLAGGNSDAGVRVYDGILIINGSEIGENRNDGVVISNSKLIFDSGSVTNNKRYGISVENNGNAVVKSVTVRGGKNGIRVSQSTADIGGNTLITENDDGIYAADNRAEVEFSDGLVAANKIGIHINEGTVAVTGGFIGEGSFGGKRYSSNNTGVYQNGRFIIGGRGCIEDRKAKRDRLGMSISDVGKNSIYLVDNKKYITVRSGAAAGREDNAGSLGQIDLPRSQNGYPQKDAAMLGRILLYVTDSGDADTYKESFTLADGIRSYNSEAHDRDNGNGDGWHGALIDAGNGSAAGEYGNILDPIDLNYSSHGVLSGLHRADFCEADSSNVYVGYSLMSSGLTSGLLNDKVALRIKRPDTGDEGQTFLWRNGYKAIADETGKGLYSAEIYYKDTGRAVPYLKHMGWIRGTDDGIDRSNSGIPIIYDKDRAAELSRGQTDHNFDWCPVFLICADIRYDGNEYGYINRNESPGEEIARARGMLDMQKRGSLPTEAFLSADKTCFTVNCDSDIKGQKFPDYCFDLDFYISEASKKYYDYGKHRYVDHHVEFSQIGWSFDKNERYDGKELKKSGEAVFGEHPENLLESLKNKGAVSYPDGRYTVTVYAILDEAPDIQAFDRYYTSDEIQSMRVDEFIKSLMQITDSLTGENQIYTFDKEDGSYRGKQGDRLTLEILNFNQAVQADREREYERDFKNTANKSDSRSPDMGGASVTYRVTDGAQNAAYYSIMIYITSSGDLKSKARWHDNISGSVDYDTNAALGVRFIDEWNYKKNPYWDRGLFDGGLTYTDEEFAVAWEAYQNGAEHPYSKWYTDRELIIKLTEGFEKLRTASSYRDYESSYTFDWDDLNYIQDYVKKYGIGKTQSRDGLKEMTEFMDSHRTASEMKIDNRGSYYSELSELKAAEKSDDKAIYTMGYPEEWLENDGWQRGKYIRYFFDSDGNIIKKTDLLR